MLRQGCFALFLAVWVTASVVVRVEGTGGGKARAGSQSVQTISASSRGAQAIEEWQALGPFVIGKSELDGDPLAGVEGGPARLAQRAGGKARRKKDSAHFFSEYVEGGEVQGWRQLRAGPGGIVQVAFDDQVRWNDLVQNGGMEVLEWQALLVARFSLEQPALVRVQCSGVPLFRVDDSPVPIAGDAYLGQRTLGQALRLQAGPHLLHTRLRAKHQGRLACSVQPLADEPLISATPLIQPDWVQGDAHPFGGWVAIAVQSLAEGWLHIGVSLPPGSPVELADAPRLRLAPSQTSTVRFKLRAKAGAARTPCSEGEQAEGPVVRVQLSAAAGGGGAPGEGEGGGRAARAAVALALRCRGAAQSAVMTFLDGDASVQHAAVVRPPSGAMCRGEESGCPVLLTLHGTSISASDSADAFKVKHDEDSDYTFGTPHGYLLAPSRFGAHNWEGIGRLHALAALEALPPLLPAVDISRVLVAGHSMGGHGAWLLAATMPDRTVALSANAGWLRKEQYGDSNTLWMHEQSLHDVEPALKAVLEASVAENMADMLASNLQFTPVVARVGREDRTVHPWFARRMVRLLRNAGAADVALTELPGKEHWWWDTAEPNDGGAVNDQQLRAFYAAHLPRPSSGAGAGGARGRPSSGAGAGGAQRCSERFTLVALNPAAMGPLCGLRLLQQRVPFRRSQVGAALREEGSGPAWHLHTRNARRLSVSLAPPGAPRGAPQAIRRGDAVVVDGVHFDLESLMSSGAGGAAAGAVELCADEDGAWRACGRGAEQGPAPGERGPASYGPLRQVLERPYRIVHGHGAGQLQAAVFLSNLLHMTGHAFAPVYGDQSAEAEWEEARAGGENVVLVGGPGTNAWAARVLGRGAGDRAAHPALHMEGGAEGPGAVQLGPCSFAGQGIGVVAMLPLLDQDPGGAPRVALLVAGTDAEGEQIAVELATPTIPPMVRQPFSNLLPDVVVLGNTTQQTGMAGMLAAGYWDNDWSFSIAASWTAYCRPRHAPAMEQPVTSAAATEAGSPRIYDDKEEL